MVFFDGTSQSLSAIVNLLNYFSSITGLTMNSSKTSLFLAGTSESEKHALATHYGFTLGSLPVRYLGLPLLSKKLTKTDYAPLIEKVKGRLYSWTSKHLSFAGRRQLISSVIQSIIAYWCAAFILPNRCIKEINKLCRKFLWSGNMDSTRKAKVKWSTVCTPKEAGGLGLRDLSAWNKLFGLKLIWLLYTQSGSLWVAWYKSNKMKGCSFWSLSEKSTGSSTWSQLLKLRPLAEEHMTCILGNGQECSFWFDKWTPFGKLINFLGPNGPSTYGIPINSKVSNVSTSLGWNIRGARSENMVTFLAYLSQVKLTVTPDKFGWLDDTGEHLNRFKFNKVRNQIELPLPEVTWHKSVWFSGNVPKHAFILWLACLDKLTTKSRLRSWGMIEDDTCVLCEIYYETRDHLFLNCPYSQDLWKLGFSRLRAPYLGFGTWQTFVSWLRRSYPNKEEDNLRLIMAHQVIYSIWKQRNDRIFTTNNRFLAEILFKKEVDRGIRNTCFARREKPGFLNSLALWFRGS